MPDKFVGKNLCPTCDMCLLSHCRHSPHVPHDFVVEGECKQCEAEFEMWLVDSYSEPTTVTFDRRGASLNELLRKEGR